MKKLVLAVLSVVAVFAALGTTTFAWFTLSGTATVGTIEVKVESGVGIELSLDGTNWKPNLTTEEIEAFIGKTYTNVPAGTNPVTDPAKFSFGAVKLTAVTPTSKTSLSNMGFKKMLLSGSYDDSNLAEANKDFIEFPLYIRVKGLGTKINWVDPTSTTEAIASNGVAWTADAAVSTLGTTPVTTVVGTEYLSAAQNAARVSVGHTIMEREVDAVGSTTHSAKLPNAVLGDGTGLVNNKGSHQYFNIKHPGTDGNGIITSGIIDTAKTLLAGFNETAALGAWQTKTTDLLGAGYELNETLTKTTNDWYSAGNLYVRIWLDGWDLDCFDAIYNDNLVVNLRFDAKEA